MEVFRDLTINLGGTTREMLIEMLEANLGGLWLHDHEVETTLSNYGGPTQHCFRWRGNDDLPSANLWLAEIRRAELQVTNIVPTEIGKLTRSQYNRILLRFVDDVLKPSTEGFGVQFHVSGDTTSVDNALPPNMAKALTAFSGAANKSTGSSHPCDFERWCTFLVEAHRSADPVDGHTLGRLLTEELGWPTETANDLVCQYELGRDLLKYYDQHREQ